MHDLGSSTMRLELGNLFLDIERRVNKIKGVWPLCIEPSDCVQKEGDMQGISIFIFILQVHFCSPDSLQWRHNEHDGFSNHRHLGGSIKRLFRWRSKKTSKLRVTGLCEGKSSVTGELPLQRTSYAENVSIWWRHHGLHQWWPPRSLPGQCLPVEFSSFIGICWYFMVLAGHCYSSVRRVNCDNHLSVTAGYNWLTCLVHPGVRDKRRVSEIDLSQPRHETAFWWRHNGPVTSQSTDPIKWSNHPIEFIGIYVNTHKECLTTQRCRRSTNVQLCLISVYICMWFES